jgi:hypothetical protein
MNFLARRRMLGWPVINEEAIIEEFPRGDRVVRQQRALAQVLAALNASAPLMETLDALLTALAIGVRLDRATLSLTDPAATILTWPAVAPYRTHVQRATPVGWILERPLDHEEHTFGAVQLSRARPA